MTRYRTWFRDRGPTPTHCFYCNAPLSEEHVQHSVETGDFQVNWEGDIGCKKCFLPQRREEIRANKASLKKLKDPKRKPKLVPLFSVSIKRKATIDWSGRRPVVEKAKVKFGKLKREY